MIDDVLARPPDLPHQGPAFFVWQGDGDAHVLPLLLNNLLR